MSGTSPSTPLPRGAADPSGAGPGDRSRSRRILVWGATVVLLALAALAAAALIPGSHSAGSSSLARSSVVAGGSPANPLHHQAKVYDSNVAASKYGTQVAARENGVNAKGQLISDLAPLRPRQFDRPVSEYRGYAERWAVSLGRDVAPLTAALRAGHRARARRDWSTAFADYLHLGAVYGLLPAGLDDRLAEVPPASDDRDFPGLHRIEQGLWTGQSLRSLVPVSTRLRRAAVTLRHTLPTVAISPLEYATRAHEILEDAQRDLMSGTEVPWSHQGVLGTAAALTATDRVIATLVPLLNGRDNTLGTTRYWLAELSHALAAVRRRDGTYPTLGRLSPARRERIDATLAGALGALSAVPGTLETKQIPEIPSIPKATG